MDIFERRLYLYFAVNWKDNFVARDSFADCFPGVARNRGRAVRHFIRSLAL